VEATDRQIEQLVYELKGLAEDENTSVEPAGDPNPSRE